ncbi:hypothetical protein LTS18_001662, partial [Coniosporium uncinatum]
MEAEERPTKVRKLSHVHERASTLKQSIQSGDHQSTSQEQTPQDESTFRLGDQTLDAPKPAKESAEAPSPAAVKPLNAATSQKSKLEPEEPTSSEARDTAEPDQGDTTAIDATTSKLHVPPGCQVPQIDPTTGQPLSKNQQKKLRRQQRWEAKAVERKAKKKEQVKAKKERKREQREADAAAGLPLQAAKSQQRPHQLPITFLFDCDFEEYMYDKELISLAAQLTRAYSDNKNAKYRAHMAISSYGGKLKERFEKVLAR